MSKFNWGIILPIALPIAAVLAAGSLSAMAGANSGKKQAPAAATASRARFGVNLAGAEFGSRRPGVFDKDYTYPSPRVLDYYKSKNRTLIRLPLKWERIQYTLNGPVAAEEMNRLRGVVRAAGERKMHIILDVHNYGRYHAAGEENSQIIGTERVPYSAFADLWGKIAAALKDEPGLFGYGLMNEPHDMGDPERWPRAAQAAIDAIRRVDTKTAIIVPGDDWSSAARWQSGSNAALADKVRDPRNNLIFEAHCYFDSDASGRYAKSYEEEGGSPDKGVERVRPFVEWCRAKNVRGFIGEFGVPHTDARWLVTMDRFLAYLQANNVSATYWAGGPWWGNYPLSIEPADARDKKEGQAESVKAEPADRPQMIVLRQYPG